MYHNDHLFPQVALQSPKLYHTFSRQIFQIKMSTLSKQMPFFKNNNSPYLEALFWTSKSSSLPVCLSIYVVVVVV